MALDKGKYLDIMKSCAIQIFQILEAEFEIEDLSDSVVSKICDYLTDIHEFPPGSAALKFHTMFLGLRGLFLKMGPLMNQSSSLSAEFTTIYSLCFGMNNRIGQNFVKRNILRTRKIYRGRLLKMYEAVNSTLLNHNESDRKLVIACFENALNSLKESNAKKWETQQLVLLNESYELPPLLLEEGEIFEKITITVLENILNFCKDSEANLKVEAANLGKINHEIDSIQKDSTDSDSFLEKSQAKFQEILESSKHLEKLLKEIDANSEAPKPLKDLKLSLLKAYESLDLFLEEQKNN